MSASILRCLFAHRIAAAVALLLLAAACNRESAEQRRTRIGTAIVNLERQAASWAPVYELEKKKDRQDLILKNVRAKVQLIRTMQIPEGDADLVRYRDLRSEEYDKSLQAAIMMKAFLKQGKQFPELIPLR